MRRIAWFIFAIPALLQAQRAFEQGNRVIFEDENLRRTDLGIGLNPVITFDSKVAFLTGPKLMYGEKFDCNRSEERNTVVVYDPSSRTQRVIFDRPLDFDGGGFKFCVFRQMQLSTNDKILYLVGAVYAAASSLAIIDLPSGDTRFVSSVESVYVILSGPHRDELICEIRVDGSEAMRYPLVHARADGTQIAEISNEFFSVGNNDELPILRAYLRKIDATINVDGRILP